MVRVCPLCSSSSGNSIYVSSGRTGILVDAGNTAKQLEILMRENQIDISTINAIFVTHEHSDHIKGLRVFASKYGIKIYASKGTMECLSELGVLNGKFTYDVITPNGIEVNEMHITPFSTSHDSRESVGYVIKTADNRKVAIVTDIGVVSDTVRSAIQGCDAIVIESNHEVRMLQNGRYPYFLKRRILSDVGHLSNESCAKELPNLVRTGTTRFILAHLSIENNDPRLAYNTSLCSLTQNGMKEDVDFKLYVAPQINKDGVHVVF